MAKLNVNDIALIAGVSNATVSRAFREPEKVSQKTRDKVMTAANNLGFTPSRLGASLKQGRTFNIVVLVPDITNPYFSPVVRSMEKTANSRGYSVLLGDTLDSPELEKSYAKMVESKQADGIIINSERFPFELNSNRDLPPVVSVSELVKNEDIYRVGVDNIAIGKLATSHLLGLGHTKIAVVSGTKNLQSCNERLAGYQLALEEAGIEYDPKLVYYAEYSAETGAQAAKQIVTDYPDVSAIFSFGDLMSIGVLHMLYKLGYKVPDKISVVSVDDIALAPFCTPPLTTIAQPMDKIGELSMSTLIDLIEKKTPQNKLSILPHKLVRRESTTQYQKPKDDD
ncbi:LacI family DNA-binding transcriptional regulator [Aliiglaciecola sp. LCG003]|uniref:LacI family DNA-binding transcriptional regulator n=1 Tax=Aliiglaciecola sp. LCG003 TaxID=3053655 RepID=UPI0025732135|nr:LacI family DNA-binding transcriptional regulator [Aliiglaciecola sp. LCG003]WJG08965.1 LacI family DNA-binding transcriptional regulator [Aliiglaciecola sp. LCG003]